jgi:hypothetical protein
MQYVLVQTAKVGFVELVSMKLIEEEEHRIILNASNSMEKISRYKCNISLRVKVLAVLSLEILCFCRLGVYNISKINGWINYINIFPSLHVRKNVPSETGD